MNMQVFGDGQGVTPTACSSFGSCTCQSMATALPTGGVGRVKTGGPEGQPGLLETVWKTQIK